MILVLWCGGFRGVGVWWWLERLLPALLVSMVGSGLEQLTCWHAVKLSPAVSCSVEECSLAVGELVGYGSMKSASRMNNAVVIFLDSADKVHRMVESGMVIRDTLTPALSLVNPAKKVIISNVQSFIRNDLLERESWPDTDSSCLPSN